MAQKFQFQKLQQQISGTITLTIQFTDGTAGNVDLDGIKISLEELNLPEGSVSYVSSVSSSGATTDTYSELIGGVTIDGSVDLSNITFNTGETTLTISMTSLNANYIKNKVSWVNTSNVTISSTSLYLPKNESGELTSGESKDLTIYVNNNTGSPTTISGLEVGFEDMGEYLLQVTAEGETSDYTGEGYWYVEMGTYSTTSNNSEGKRESEYLRWRYFSDTTSHYEFDRNARPTGEGYFILETYTSAFNSTEVNGIRVSWNNDYTYRSGTDATHNYNGWTNIDANDYSTSNIRQYINSEDLVSKSYTSTSSDAGTIYSPSADLEIQSNMFIDLHIDPDNDFVYSQIIGRSLVELYTDMNASTSGGSVEFPDLSSADEGYRYQETDTDKFWLLSYYEAYTLLSGNATIDIDSDREWGLEYALRTPENVSVAKKVISGGALEHHAHGGHGGGVGYSYEVHLDDSAARAAFKFSVDEL